MGFGVRDCASGVLGLAIGPDRPKGFVAVVDIRECMDYAGKW